MTSKAVLSRLETRAIEAQRLIKSLKSEIALLNKSKHGLCVDQECKDLNLENEKLKKEIEVWKQKLTAAEIANGKLPVNVAPSCSKPDGAKLLKSNTSEPLFNGDVMHKEGSGSESAPPEIKSVTDQEKVAKRKSTDKKPKPEPKKDSASDKLDDKVDVGRLDIRIGRIMDVKKHPDADSLYVESVNLGEEKERTVVSGLVRFIERTDLEGRMVALLCNLKPAKMRGVTSEAMVLCASTPVRVEVLNPPPGSVPGDIVTCEGFAHRPDPVLNPKKKVWETVATDLKVDSSGVATYKGVPLVVSGKGHIRSTALTDVPIK